MTTPVVHLIMAARPNFIKVAPLYHALRGQDWCCPILVYTGQHYDRDMAEVFFADLDLPAPDIHLGVGSGTHAEQTAGVMLAYESVCLRARPDCVIVVGDVNSTLACALVAKKLCIPVAHLEAGLRSRDRSMPEEINRIATDAISDLLWTPSADADDNLKREGMPANRVECVGNIMLDSYELLKEKIDAENVSTDLGLVLNAYSVVTLHRPVNVDDREKLRALIDLLQKLVVRLPVVFPVHPRTLSRLKSFELLEPLRSLKGVMLTEPMGYIRFMSLVKGAKIIITDSGGIQEETTYLGIPCLTLRNSTERPITLSEGSNRLVDLESLVQSFDEVLSAGGAVSRRPELWDGQTASRVVTSLKRFLQEERPRV